MTLCEGFVIACVCFVCRVVNACACVIWEYTQGRTDMQVFYLCKLLSAVIQKRVSHVTMCRFWVMKRECARVCICKYAYTCKSFACASCIGQLLRIALHQRLCVYACLFVLCEWSVSVFMSVGIHASPLLVRVALCCYPEVSWAFANRPPPAMSPALSAESPHRAVPRLVLPLLKHIEIWKESRSKVNQYAYGCVMIVRALVRLRAFARVYLCIRCMGVLEFVL